MSSPFRGDGVPEPSWLRYGPPDPPEPPDNYLPDEARRALSELVEFLEGDLEEVAGQFLAGTNEAERHLRKAADKAYEEWKAATKKFQTEVEVLWDETVGDNWGED